MAIKFKIGQKVRRNNIQYLDSNEIPINTIGVITAIASSQRQPYRVCWPNSKYWWIHGDCISLVDIKDSVNLKIKELEEKFRKKHGIRT
jgi:hypothetical protein